MNFTTLLSKMLVLFAFIGVGLLCEKLDLIMDSAVQSLNKLVIYICAPCIILKSVFSAAFTYAVRDVLRLLVYSSLYNAITLGLAFLFAGIIRPSKEDKMTVTVLTGYSNCVFMGFPIISAVFGDSALLMASVCTIPFNFFLYTIGTALLSGKGSIRKMLMSTFVNPNFFATVIALIIFFVDLRIPQPVQEFVTYLGNIVVPFAMMLIGVSLSSVPAKELFLDLKIYLIVLCRLIVIPVLTFLILRPIIKEALFLNLLTVFSVMPSASATPIFCREYGGNPLLASKSVFLSTVLAMLTVPILLSFLLI